MLLTAQNEYASLQLNAAVLVMLREAQLEHLSEHV